MNDLYRPNLRAETKEMIEQGAQIRQTNEKGQLIDPNTHEVLDEKAQYGHVTGMENRGFLSYGNKCGMEQSELNNTVNNAGLYQQESRTGNQSHNSEEKDENAIALNTANYCYLENPQYQQNTYINPPSSENEPWTVTVTNVHTGIESQVGTFQPDLGTVTPESQASMHSAAPSYSSNETQTCDNDMSDFGSGSTSESQSSDGNCDENGDCDGDENGLSL